MRLLSFPVALITVQSNKNRPAPSMSSHLAAVFLPIVCNIPLAINDTTATINSTSNRFMVIYNNWLILLNHAYSIALHFMYYNFIRVHASLDGLTPAQTAGMADRPYTMGWLFEKVERAQPKPNRPTFYQPRQSRLTQVLQPV